MLKAVVLARGKGTRMQRRGRAEGLTDEQVRMADAGGKAMMPFGGRPFLDYVLSALADAGCRDVCLVVAPDHELIRDYYTAQARPRRVRITYAVQREARGTADAVLAARDFTGDEPFLVMNSDNYYPVDVLRQLAALDGPGLPAFSRSALLADGLIEPGRVRAYAALRIAPDGTLQDIIEKPDESTLASFGEEFFVSMNCWRLETHIFDACRQVEPSPRGEVELPEAVRFAVRMQKHVFHTFPVHAGVLDLSHRSDVAVVAERLAAIEAHP